MATATDTQSNSPWSRYNPGPVAQRIWACRKHTIAVDGPVGTAKTSILCLYIAGHCVENHGAKWLFIRRTAQSLKDNTVNGTWLRWFPDGVAGHLSGSERNLDFHLDCIFMGKRAIGTVMFRPADQDEDVHRFMGGEYAGVAFDEASGTDKEEGLSEGIYTNIQTRLRQPGIHWACHNCLEVMPDELIPEDVNQDWTDCPWCKSKGSVSPRYHLLVGMNPPPPGNWLYDEFPEPPQQTKYKGHFQIPIEDNVGNVPRGYYSRVEEQWKAAGKQDYVARYLRGERVPLGRATCVFNREILLRGLQEWAKPPIARGYLDTDKETKRAIFKEDSEGPLRIWEFPAALNWESPKPFNRQGKFVLSKDADCRPDRYVLGMDAGRGLRDGDASCGLLGSRVTGNLVAEWYGHINPRRFGQEMARFARWYNEAFIVPEGDPSSDGRAACDALEDTNYYNIYQPYQEKRIGDVTLNRYGLEMHRAQKVRLVSYARDVIEDHTFIIPIRELFLELLGFVEKPPREGQREGKLEGDSGFKDDRVTAYLLFLEGLQREGMWVPPPSVGLAPRWMHEMLVRYDPTGMGNRSWMSV